MFKPTFHGGILLEGNKADTIGLPAVLVPAPERLFVSLLQHQGTPANSVVSTGDHLLMGQPIAASGNGLSAPVHSPVSGIVKSVGPRLHPHGMPVECVEIENDGKDTWFDHFGLVRPFREAAPGEILNLLGSLGVVGLGGQGYPTQHKLSFSAGCKADTLIVNAIESEPFCVADQRLVIEKTESVLTGVQIARKIVGAKNVIIAVTSTAGETIKALVACLSDERFKDISLVKLKPRYPQGNERQLVVKILSREIPAGGTPIDVGCAVCNVATLFAIYQAIIDGTPVIDRYITVAGTGVARPGAYRVRIGTPISTILECAGYDGHNPEKIICGGLLRGAAQSDRGVPVIKTTTSIMVTDVSYPAIAQSACISCGYCVQSCPSRLVPSEIARLVLAGRYEALPSLYVDGCIECGCCAYVCPSRINLLHCMKLAKHTLTHSPVQAE